MKLEQLRPDAREAFNHNETLYHKDIGFPDDLEMPRGFNPVMHLNYGGHARFESMADRYGKLRLPRQVDIRKGEVIEVGVQGKTVTKVVVRFPYDEVKDLVIVIMLPTGFVKTVWANLKTDKHATLNRSKYADPNKKPLTQPRV